MSYTYPEWASPRITFLDQPKVSDLVDAVLAMVGNNATPQSITDFLNQFATKDQIYTRAEIDTILQSKSTKSEMDILFSDLVQKNLQQDEALSSVASSKQNSSISIANPKNLQAEDDTVEKALQRLNDGTFGHSIESSSTVLPQRQVIKFDNPAIKVSDDGTQTIINLDTVVSSIFVGDLTGVYAGLALEANWTNNVCTSVAGTLGTNLSGTTDLGCLYYVFYTQSCWLRIPQNPYIDIGKTNGLALANQLNTTTNWTTGVCVASYGDKGQKYVLGNIEYECIDGSTHSWIMKYLPQGLPVTISADITFIPQRKTTVFIDIANSINTFIVPAGYYLSEVIYQTTTETTSGTIAISDYVSGYINITVPKAILKPSNELSCLPISDTDKTYTVTGAFTKINLLLLIQKFQ